MIPGARRDHSRGAGAGGAWPDRPRARFGVAPIRAIHAIGYLDYLEHAYERWVAAGGNAGRRAAEHTGGALDDAPLDGPLVTPGYYSFDLSAPIVAGTYRAARAAADAALTGAALLLEGERLVVCALPAAGPPRRARSVRRLLLPQ